MRLMLELDDSEVLSEGKWVCWLEDDSDIRGPGSVFIHSSSLHTDTVDVVLI